MKLFTLILLAALSISCQKVTTSRLSKVNKLPKVLNEISGITVLPNHKLYAINDSGNDNTLFILSQKGNIEQQVKIPNAKNIDWEDLAYDKNNTIYIGDFGNNKNKRKDLTIYKVSGILTNTINVSKIEFVFEDQKKFPPKKKNLNFDVEAFIHLNHSLYLFTKNRSSKSEGITKLYKVSDSSGKHIAKLVGTYEVCENSSDCFITGAAINQSQNKIALLTHQNVILLSNFKDDNLFNGSIKNLKLHHYSQKEGICFKNDTTLFITDEKTGDKKACLYEYQLE
ncbi:SdiA-regulated domain-containing protein [Aquimarina longa]|uniref:SdiA-regulated domain-containing protein n=1 Tax=Aquimarina longa TaxID=1080221 RepID=UPI0007838EA0|nr:SdiA-regulated domain-containing protein [Aquimarina longa]